jgi:ribosome-associated translation inhibitor RaiA
MEDTQMSRATASYTARLDRTLRKLQDRVKEQEAVLEKVRVNESEF